MRWLIESGRIADVIVALTLAEWLALAAWHRRTGGGVAGADLAGNLLAGVCLVLALRCALTEAGWGWIALWLAASLGAHLADLRRRWRRPPGG